VADGGGEPRPGRSGAEEEDEASDARAGLRRLDLELGDEEAAGGPQAEAMRIDHQLRALARPHERLVRSGADDAIADRGPDSLSGTFKYIGEDTPT
jgi:hypothetical protein